MEEGWGGILNRRRFLERTVLAGAGLTSARCLEGNFLTVGIPNAVPKQPETREWTLEEAKKLWRPMSRAVQHVGVPGHQWQTGILWDGSLIFGPLAG
jgi:hypothetical protein